MSTAERKAIVRRYLEEVYNQGNLALIDELVAPDFVDHNVPSHVPPGPDNAMYAVMTLRNALPDYQYTIEDLIVEGEKVVARWSAHCADDTLALGRRPASLVGVSIFRVANGQLREEWFNRLTMLQQLSRSTSA